MWCRAKFERARLLLGLCLLLQAGRVAGADGAGLGVPSLNHSGAVPLIGAAGGPTVTSPPGIGWPLQEQLDFATNTALDRFAFSDPAAWKLTGVETNGGLELVAQSQYAPAVRSPVNLAVLADRQFGDFLLECDLMQTGREYGHRDMCLFFGLQNPTNFYYVHLATAADEHAHNIFLVRNAPRTKIANETTAGVNWGLNVWHRVRLERRVAEGTIRVWFDDLDRPIMQAVDRSFGAGYLGFGSFDDTGRIDNVRIWSPEAKPVRLDWWPRR